jgi:hypothetical protein
MYKIVKQGKLNNFNNKYIIIECFNNKESDVIADENNKILLENSK